LSGESGSARPLPTLEAFIGNTGITHFVSSMGITGTIMGVSRFLKEENSNLTTGVFPD